MKQPDETAQINSTRAANNRNWQEGQQHHNQKQRTPMGTVTHATAASMSAAYL
jgi:hypothetical protein